MGVGIGIAREAAEFGVDTTGTPIVVGMIIVLEKVSTVAVGIVAEASIKEEATEFAPAMGTTEKSMPVVAANATPGGAATATGIVVAVVTVVLELISDE